MKILNRPEFDNAILVGYRGSITHGTYVPSSDPNSIDDIDIMGIVIPPINHYFGLKSFGSRGTKDFWEDEYDVVIYELKKFIGLLMKMNPNVLSLLYLEDKHYLLKTEIGQALISNRELFLSKKHIYNAYLGYSKSQLKKMTAFNKQGYMGEKRKALVDKYGYDTKNAAHLIRLLSMGIEFLERGTLFVNRTGLDAEYLKMIKSGKYSLDEIKTEAEWLFNDMENAYKESNLPEENNEEKISNFCTELLSIHFAKDLR